MAQAGIGDALPVGSNSRGTGDACEVAGSWDRMRRGGIHCPMISLALGSEPVSCLAACPGQFEIVSSIQELPLLDAFQSRQGVLEVFGNAPERVR